MKILIVEDNRDIAENIADYLEPKGHVLDFATNGKLGLQLATEERYDVIVLDIMLPQINGMEVCRRIREHSHITTPIIMLTARDQLDDKVEGFEAGADDYLVKPFSIRELEVRLAALVKRDRKESAQTAIQVGDLSFDPQTLKATRAGKDLSLNPIQRKLLQMLMVHSDRVVAREEIEDAIWGDELPDNDILRTHIYNLRSVVDKPFSEKLIHTVHGVGYRLYQKQAN
ncbi:MAG: response regulator transcription factor [Pseudohongiellaceae bacterium]|nr:response regulator transcription factor [Pseudohongiellaceae bacterium]